jgi:hypothetical protein
MCFFTYFDLSESDQLPNNGANNMDINEPNNNVDPNAEPLVSSPTKPII